MYELNRMDGTSFERLIRALCFKTFGSGGIVYSPGSDGGRDFTFRGKIQTYESKGWDGYLVVQSKYVENNGRSKAEQIQGLIARISEEIEAFMDKQSGRELPDYYIIVTNLDLSGADKAGTPKSSAKTGSHTKVSQPLTQWKRTKKIIDYDIWHQSKIEDLLSNNIDVRRSFSAYVTSGDILNAAIENLNITEEPFISAITTSLKHDLKRDRFVKLKDAGDVAEMQIRSGQVFIDLPIDMGSSKNRLNTLSQLNIREHINSRPMIGASLIRNSRSNFSFDTVADNELTDKMALPNSNNGRNVILGGPGQGKSTATTFLAQVYRAVLLRDLEKRIDPTVGPIVTEILERAQRQGISLDVPRRYPLVISLPQFADIISKSKKSEEKAPSLLSYAASELSKSADRNITKEHLRKWLKNYAWIVVLDGLDEVPNTGERSNLLEAISNFESEVHDACADVMITITTRPQGYNQDLDASYWQHHRLADLSVKEAIDYSADLSMARYPEDKSRRDELYNALALAAERQDTARLMISPLQVSIMHLIVDIGGSVPSGRWGLFNEYFEILRKREKAKGKDIQKVIERNWTLLPPTHQRAGLILQVDSEIGGGADAKLSHAKFKDMLHDYLVSQGFDQSNSSERVAELFDVATNRLVLLSTREEGFVSFDVRSLQEYMAAAALTANDAKVVTDRLIHIAQISHWRHVFLIAVSRCFTDDAFFHLRDAIVAIPRTLDLSYPDRLVRNGSSLSLDMFIDGIGVEHPNSRRQLVAHALDLLDHGVVYYDSRLPRIWEHATEEIIESNILERIKGDSWHRASGAWKFLLESACDGVDRALKLVNKHLPIDLKLRCKILIGHGIVLKHQSLIDIALDACTKLTIQDVNHLFNSTDSIGTLRRLAHDDPYRQIVALDIVRRFNSANQEPHIPLLAKGPRTGLSVRIISIFDQTPYDQIASVLSRFPGRWRPIASCIEFVRAPSTASLSALLLELSLPGNFEEAKFMCLNTYPWIVSRIVELSKTPADLLDASKRASTGAFGTEVEWRKAEERWNACGITIDDISNDGDGLGIGSDIDVVGSPLIVRLSVSHGSEAFESIRRGMDALDSKMHPAIRTQLAHAIHFGLIGVKSEQSITSLDFAKRVLSMINTDCSDEIYMDIFDAFDPSLWRNRAFVEACTRIGDRCVPRRGHMIRENIEHIFQAIHKNTDCRGLIPLLVCYSLGRGESEHKYFAEIEPKILEIRPSDSLITKFYLVCLAIMAGYEPHIKEIDFLDAFHALPRSTDIEIIVEDVFGSDSLDAECRQKFLSIMLSKNDLPEDLLTEINVAYSGCLDTRKTRFRNREFWLDSMNLPAETYQLLRIDDQKIS